ncbi:trichohyalin-like isoform X2 [Nothobranchius furzeri]|uniref:trichohyalin-like isoform X2 n=1 Tax=Nothobranchius furzeri TaxID=105023 RepID=UPI003904B551
MGSYIDQEFNKQPAEMDLISNFTLQIEQLFLTKSQKMEELKANLNDHLLFSNEQSIKNETSFPIINQLSEDFEQKFREERDSHLQTKEVNQELIERLKADNGALFTQMDETKTALEEMKVSHQKLLEKYNKYVLTTQEMIEHLEIELEDEKEAHQMTISQMRANIPEKNKQEEPNKDLLKKMRISHQEPRNMFEDKLLYAKQKVKLFEKAFQKEFQKHQITKTKLEDLRSKMTQQCVAQQTSFQETEPQLGQAEGFENELKKQIQAHEQTKTKCEDLDSTVCEQCVWHERRFIRMEKEMRQKRLEERNVLLDETQRCESELIFAKRQVEEIENELKKEIQAHEQTKTKCKDLDSTVCEQCVWHEQRFIRMEKEMRQKRLEEQNLLLDEKQRCESELILAKRQVEGLEKELEKQIQAHEQTKTKMEDLICETTHEFVRQEKGFKLREKEMREKLLEEQNVLLDEVKQRHESEIISAKRQVEGLEKELEKQIQAHEQTKTKMEDLICETTHEFFRQEKGFKLRENEMREKLLEEQNVLLDEVKQRHESEIISAKRQVEGLEKELEKQIQAHEQTKTKCEDLDSTVCEQCVWHEQRFIRMEKEMRQKRLEEQNLLLDEKQRCESELIFAKRQVEGLEKELEKQIQAHEQTKTKMEDLICETTHEFVRQQKGFQLREKEMHEKLLEEQNVLLDEVKQRHESEIISAKRQVEGLEKELEKQIQAHEQTKTKCEDLGSTVCEQCVWHEQRFIRMEKEMRRKRLEEQNLLLDEKQRCESELILAKRQVEEIENELKKEIQAHEQTKTKLEDLSSEMTHEFVRQEKGFKLREKEMREKLLEEQNVLLDEKQRCESELILAKRQVEEIENELKKEIQAHEQTKTKCKDLDSTVCEQCVWHEQRFIRMEKEMRQKRLEEQNLLLDEKQRCESELILAKRQVEGLEKELEKQIQAHEQTKTKMEDLICETTHEFVRQEKGFKLREKEMREKLLEEQNVLLDEVKQRHESEIISAKRQVEGLEKELEKQIQAHVQTKTKMEDLICETTHEFFRQEKGFKLRENEMREKLLEEQNVLLDEVKQRHESEIISAKRQVEGLEKELEKQIQAHEQTKTKCEDLDSTVCEQCVWHEQRFIRMEKEMRQKRLEEQNLLLDEKQRCESELIFAKRQVEGLEKELEKQIQAHEQTKTKMEDLICETTHEFVRQQKGFQLREKEMHEKLLEEQNVLLDEVKQRHESEIISAKRQVEGLEKELEKQIQAHEQTKTKCEDLGSTVCEQCVWHEQRFIRMEKEMRRKRLEEQNLLLDEKQRCESELILAKRQVEEIENELKKEIQAHEQTVLVQF